MYCLFDPLQQMIDSGTSRTTTMVPRRLIRAGGGAGHRCPPTPRGPSTRAHTPKYTRALPPSSTFPCRRKAMRHRSNHAHYAVFSPVQFAHASSNGSSVEPKNSFGATSASSSVTHRKKRPCWSIGHTVSCRSMASPLWSFWHRRCVRLH